MTSQRLLVRALRTAGFDHASADEAAAHVLSQAWLVVQRGGRVESELGWISAVAASSRSAVERARLRDRSVHDALQCLRRWKESPPGACRVDPRERLHDAFRSLPPPYSHAAALRGVHGYTERRITEWLQMRRPISPRQGRKIQSQAVVMLRAALAGDDPRRIWPQRFLGKNPWIGVALVPIETLLSVEDVRTGS